MTFWKYWWLRLKHPKQVDYLNMGFGIEARHQRCAAYWHRHLQYSQEFVQKSFENFHGQSLAVFGAGRLLDVDLSQLLQHFSEVQLFDYDPSVLPFWQAATKRIGAKGRVRFCIADVTATIEPWTEWLRASLEKGSSSEDFATQLLNLSVAAPTIERTSACLSLNLLSQIPLYWRDRVEAEVGKHFGQSEGQDFLGTPEVAYALNQTLRLLELEHLGFLARSASERIVMLHDIQFFYYHADKVHWQVEPALELTDPIVLLNFNIDFQDQWFWHIAPQGIEQAEYGVIHDVRAICLKR
jgi:hypothetical protein